MKASSRHPELPGEMTRWQSLFSIPTSTCGADTLVREPSSPPRAISGQPPRLSDGELYSFFLLRLSGHQWRASIKKSEIIAATTKTRTKISTKTRTNNPKLLLLSSDLMKPV